MLVLSAVVMAQDADKQKLIEIEKAFAANATQGPELAALAKQYFYDGPSLPVDWAGAYWNITKARVVELYSKPDPSDPNVKSSASVSDIRVELYGDTALATYKFTNTDTGHKDPALNTTDHFGCLDTFVKRNGQWYLAGGACSHEGPIIPGRMDRRQKGKNPGTQGRTASVSLNDLQQSLFNTDRNSISYERPSFGEFGRSQHPGRHAERQVRFDARALWPR